MTEREQKLADCFALVFPELSPEEIRRISFVSMPEWDSIASINLIAVIDEEFGIQTEPEDWEELGDAASFETVLEVIERYL